MVLKSLSDSREMLDYRNSKVPEFGFLADTRLQHDLRRVYRTKRQNHLAAGANATSASFIRNLEAAGAVALESEPSNQRVREHREVWLVHAREDVRTENRLAFSIANAHVGNGCTAIGLHDAAVLILKDRNPKRPHSLKQSLNGRCGIALQRLDKYRSAGPAISWIGCSLPVLNAAINIKNRFIAPRWVPRFGCKEVPVALVTASPDHRIDTRSTAQNLSHAHRNGAAVQVWVWLGVELPVSFASDIGDPLACIRDTWYVIVATCFQQ